MGHGIGGVTLSGLFAAANLLGRDLVPRVLGHSNRISDAA
jgi:hypothetical protein